MADPSEARPERPDRPDRSTRDLVLDAAGGDLVAFARLVSRYEARARAVALSVGVDPTGAEDVAQETFVAAFRGLAALDDPAAFGAWVAGVARNQAVSWLRREGRSPAPRSDLESLAIPDRADGPVEALERESRRAEVRRALDGLSERERLALCLKHHAGLTYAEIAETMTLPATTIKGLLERATRALRARLAPPRERTSPS